MDTLKLLRDHQADAEMDAAVWIDDQPLLRRAAGIIAHNRILRALTIAAVAPTAAAIGAAAAVIEASRVLDRAHEIAGEGTDPCRPCVTAEADQFAANGLLTYEDFCHALDLGDL